jgi:2-oxoglutarate/2-oxoacid ferredoxin oxidoreductase subunit beta
MKQTFAQTPLLNDKAFQFCPGCTHGTTLRLIAEALDQLGLGSNAIGMTGDGCMAWAPQYLEVDITLVLHGRAPAVATGVKRARPENLVFTIQGDGDLGSIGIGEVLHAASRGEDVTVICVNNATLGMTHGQMSPTSLPGQKTTITPAGRDPNAKHGHTMDLSEMVAQQGGVAYLARASLHDAKATLKAKKHIRRAFEVQMMGRGFTMVELLSSCPTNWKMSPPASLEHIEDTLVPAFPLGVLVDTTKDPIGAEVGL